MPNRSYRGGLLTRLAIIGCSTTSTSTTISAATLPANVTTTS